MKLPSLYLQDRTQPGRRSTAVTIDSRLTPAGSRHQRKSGRASTQVHVSRPTWLFDHDRFSTKVGQSSRMGTQR